MTPEEKHATLMKMGEIVENLSDDQRRVVEEEFLFWNILNYPERVKEFFSVKEDFRRQFNIEI